jgi:hypothetical protein
MASKYDYLVTKNITRSTIYPPFKNMIAHTLKDQNFQIRFTHVSEPFDGKEDAHSHDFSQVLYLYPALPT